MKKEYTVVSKPGVDVAEIDADLALDGSSVSGVPSRPVEMADPKPSSSRRTSWYLTDEEAKALEADPRVEALSIIPEGVVLTADHSQKGNFYRKPTANRSLNNPLQTRKSPDKYPAPIESGTHMNWGLYRCNYHAELDNDWWRGEDEDGNPRWTTGVPEWQQGWNNETIHLGATGKGVDIVIMDTGLQVNHEEFLDSNGNSRVRMINWYDYSSISGTLPFNFYTNAEYHGTHVASTAAGKRHGWAKDAHIYPMNVLGDRGSAIDLEQGLDLIKDWHTSKNDPNSPHYTGRPTVLNMSLSYTYESASPRPNYIDSIVYRGTTYENIEEEGSAHNSRNIAEQYDTYGITSPQNSGFRDAPVEIVSINTALQEVIDAGVFVANAAGNRAHIMIEKPADYLDATSDWNNLVTFHESNYQSYYMRPNTPYSPDAMFVANLSNVAPTSGFNMNFEHIASSSGTGSAVDIIAPGSTIMSASEPYFSATSPIVTETGENLYFYNPSDPDNLQIQESLTGTSMASPQVAGIAALHLGENPDLTPLQVKKRILSDALPLTNLYKYEYTKHTSSAAEYTPVNYGLKNEGGTANLNGTPPLLLLNRYNKKPIEFKGDFTLNESENSGAAALPDYTTHSTVTCEVSSVKGFPAFEKTVTVQIKTAADVNVTESVGDVQITTTHGAIKTISDNGNGTYTAIFEPPFSTNDNNFNCTISASIRPHNLPVYQAIANTQTVSVTPSTAELYVTDSFNDKGDIPYYIHRYAAGDDSAIYASVQISDRESSDTSIVTAPFSLGKLGAEYGILAPGIGTNIDDYYRDRNNGSYNYFIHSPTVPGLKTHTIDLLGPNNSRTSISSNTVNYMEDHPWHELYDFECWPPVVPNDNNAKQSIRAIPKRSDGSLQDKYVGQWTFGTPRWGANKKGSKAYHLETVDYEDAIGDERVNAVVHRVDYISNQEARGNYSLFNFQRVGDYHNTEDVVLHRPTVEGQFSASTNTYRAYYSTMEITNADTVSVDGVVNIRVIPRSSQINTISGQFLIQIIHPVTGQELVMNRVTGSEYTLTISDLPQGKHRLVGKFAGVFMRERPFVNLEGSDFTSFSTIEANPQIIDGSEFSNITVTIKGDPETTSTVSQGPITISSSTGFITNTVDNQDGTYSAIYNPPATSNASSTAIISASLANHGPLTAVASVTAGQSDFYKYATLTTTAGTISTNTSTKVTLQLRRASGNIYPYDVGNVAITTDIGILSNVGYTTAGRYEGTLQTNGTLGTATLRATVHGLTTINSTQVLFTAAAGYANHSVISSQVGVLTGNGEQTTDLTFTLKSDATTFATESVGDLQVTVSDGKIIDTRDNGDGTYTARYVSPLTQVSQTPVTITANIGDDISFSRSDVLTINGVDSLHNTVRFQVGESAVSEYVGFQVGDLHIEDLGDYTVAFSRIHFGLPESIEFRPIPGFRYLAVLAGTDDLWVRLTNRSSLATLPVDGKSYYRYVNSPMDISSSGSFNWDRITLTNIGTLDTYEFNRTDASFFMDTNQLRFRWNQTLLNADDEMLNNNVFDISNESGGTVNVNYSVHSTITATPSNNIPADGASPTTITVQLKTASDNFATASGGTLELQSTRGVLSEVTDNQDGTYTATLTSTTDGLATISGYINGILINDTQAVTFIESTQVNYTTYSTVEIEDTRISSADRFAAADLVFQHMLGDLPELDSRLNEILTAPQPIPHQDKIVLDVNRSGTITSADATQVLVSAPGTSGGVDHFYRVLAENYGHITNTFTGTNGTSYTLFNEKPYMDNILADGVQQSKVKVTLKTNYNAPLTASGGTVALTATTGTLSNVTDHNDGTYTAIYTAPVDTLQANPQDQLNVVAAITATIDGDTINDTAQIQLRDPQWYKASTITSSANSIFSTETATLTVQAKRSDGINATSSVGTLTFNSFGAAPPNPQITNITDNENGTYTATFDPTSNTAFASVNIEPSFNGAEWNDSQHISIEVRNQTALYLQHSTVTTSSSSISSNTGQATVTVQLKTAADTNSTESGGTVTVTATNGVSVGGVTDHQDGTYTAVLTAGSQTGTSIISATLEGQNIVDTATLTISGATNPYALQRTITIGSQASQQVGNEIKYNWGFGYNSFTGVNNYGTMSPNNGFDLLSGYHILGLFCSDLFFLNGYFAFKISNQEVGGSSGGSVPSGASTCFTTMRVTDGNNTIDINRTDASYADADGMPQWLWTENSATIRDADWGEVWDNTGVTETITWDPTD